MPFDLVVTTRSDLERHAENRGLIYRAVLREGREVYAAEGTGPGSPSHWLRHARSELSPASDLLPLATGVPDQSCRGGGAV